MIRDYDSWKLRTPEDEQEPDTRVRCVECDEPIPPGDVACGVETCMRCDEDAHPEHDLVDDDLARGESPEARG